MRPLVLAATAATLLVLLGPAAAGEPPAVAEPAASEPAPVPATEPAADGELLAARVDGVGISRAEFDRNWRAFLAKSGIPLDHSETGGGVSPFRRQVIEGLVDEELIAQEAQRLGYGATPEETAAEVAEARAKFPDEEEYRTALAGSGLTEERLGALYARRIGIEKFVEAEIAAATEVGDEEVAAFYRENPSAFERPEQLRARHILVAVEEGADEETKAQARARAEELLERVRAGEDFGEIARESSDCPSAAEGGDLGFFSRGQMVAPFDEAAFALAPGETSGIVETRYGFHIIRAEELRPAGAVPESEAAPSIREHLRTLKGQQALKDRIAGLRAKAKIEILLEN